MTQTRLWDDQMPEPIGWYCRVGEHEWEERDKDGNVVARHLTSRPRKTAKDKRA